MIKSLFLAVAFVLTASFSALKAEEAPVPTSDQTAIRSVIEAQLEAFQRDDGQTAFSYASPTIKQIFGTPERFMSMVRSGYPAVYRPQATEFRKLHQEGPTLVQEIRFVGPDGQAVIALYSLVKQPDGNWLIDGVVIIPAPEQAV